MSTQDVRALVRDSFSDEAPSETSAGASPVVRLLHTTPATVRES